MYPFVRSRIKIRTFLLTFRISFAAYLPWHGNPGWYPILAALSKKENINWILFLNRHFGHVFRRKNRGYLISESLAAASTPRNLHQRVDSTIITNSSSLPYYHGIYIWLLYTWGQLDHLDLLSAKYMSHINIMEKLATTCGRKCYLCLHLHRSPPKFIKCIKSFTTWGNLNHLDLISPKYTSHIKLMEKLASTCGHHHQSSSIPY